MTDYTKFFDFLTDNESRPPTRGFNKHNPGDIIVYNDDIFIVNTPYLGYFVSKFLFSFFEKFNTPQLPFNYDTNPFDVSQIFQLHRPTLDFSIVPDSFKNNSKTYPTLNFSLIPDNFKNKLDSIKIYVGVISEQGIRFWAFSKTTKKINVLPVFFTKEHKIPTLGNVYKGIDIPILY